MPNPFIWILEKILGPRMTVEERIAHNKRLAGISTDNVAPADGPPIDRQIDALIEKIRSMRAPIMSCRPRTGEVSDRADESRLGGWPGWPEGEDLPKGPENRPMLFLCQINFAEMPPFDPFPNEGLMQIFVASGDLFGCAFPSADRNGFRVLYRRDTSGLTTLDPYGGNALERSVFTDDLQRNGCPLSFELRDMIPTLNHFRIDAEIQALWRQDEGADIDRIDHACHREWGTDMYLGGYPRFVQRDIRSPDSFSDYDQVIMQFAAPKGMMWGDLGEACFLMRREDLQNRAFEKAIYNWDCS